MITQFIIFQTIHYIIIIFKVLLGKEYFCVTCITREEFFLDLFPLPLARVNFTVLLRNTNAISLDYINRSNQRPCLQYCNSSLEVSVLSFITHTQTRARAHTHTHKTHTQHTHTHTHTQHTQHTHTHTHKTHTHTHT